MGICTRRSFCLLVFGAAASVSLSGCDASSFISSKLGHSAFARVVYVPEQSSYTPSETGAAYLVDEDGTQYAVRIEDDAIFDSDGAALCKADFEPGDIFDVYEQDASESTGEELDGVVYADSMILVERGGKEAADEANLAYAQANAVAKKLVYTPKDDDDYASNVDGSNTTMWCVLVDEDIPANGGLAKASIPDLAMYGMDGALLEVSDLQPGDVFAAYQTGSSNETYPSRVHICRLELVEHGGQEALDEVADETAYFEVGP